ncbi:hypothetical protein NDU88_002915, partial [Pleurodeles waltl]
TFQTAADRTDTLLGTFCEDSSSSIKDIENEPGRHLVKPQLPGSVPDVTTRLNTAPKSDCSKGLQVLLTYIEWPRRNWLRFICYKAFPLPSL